jgi:ubiquinone/menaquinone biosynthesis C-methylase UbiE
MQQIPTNTYLWGVNFKGMINYQRTYIYFFAIILLCGLISCKEKNPSNGGETPSMIRTQTGNNRMLMPDLTELPNQGNFTGMVADYESKDRVIWQKPEMVISMLGDLEGKTVADIGAGTGFFTFRLVPKAKKVIGIDIDQRFITFLDSIKVRLPLDYRNRFESRLAKAEDPMLKSEEVNAIVIVNTYGYIENRVAYLKLLMQGLTKGGQLLIIDFKKNNVPVGPSDEFKVSLPQVEKELLSAGFSITAVNKDALDYQYILLATKP